ncbi:MAG: rhomboid family intramembrane serine protease [Flavicella sp.]
MNQVQTLLNKYRRLTIVEKLITLNCIVFVLTFAINTLVYLTGTSGNIIIDGFALSSDTSEFIFKPWSLLSYGFMHAGFFHLLTNMIILYYMGNLFVEYFTPKRLLNFYWYGTAFGGILFLLSYAFFPTLKNSNSILVGASAAVMAIFIGITTYMPNYELRFRFIGYVKLWKLAAIFIALDIIQIPSSNAGGHIAHLGGALFGFFQIYFEGNKTISIQNPFTNLFKKRPVMKTVYKNHETKKESSSVNNQKIIDAILDKISKSGYDSLSKKEKDILFRQGKNNL